MTGTCFLETQPLIANPSVNTLPEIPDTPSQDLSNDHMPDRKIDVQVDEENVQQDHVDTDDVHSHILVDPRVLLLRDWWTAFLKNYHQHSGTPRWSIVPTCGQGLVSFPLTLQY